MLSDEQLASFARDGYLVVPQVITEELLAQAGATVDRLIRAQPPPAGHAGAHFYWPSSAEAPELVTLARDGGLIELAGELAGPGTIDIAFDQTQVALNIPPNLFDPGGPHLDGYQPGCTEPGSFTLLGCVLLSDQQQENCGNLWVWPGTHQTHAAYFAEHGPEAFFTAQGYPPVTLPEPIQIQGQRGDVLLAHYLLGHNIGGNYAGDRTRQALYWRLLKRGHTARWRACLTDHTREFESLHHLW